MSIPTDARGLRSQRYVTQGYRNVFHRAFLYGMGLSSSDLEQPFVGLAVAHNEALPGQSLVRALADSARRSLAVTGLTQREFAVPETRHTTRSAAVGRELVADSAELVVRGHWYDGLVGVAASVPAAFGLAETLVRLRVPGVVLMPAEHAAEDPQLDGAGAFLSAIGLGAVIPADGTGLLTVFERLRDQVQTPLALPFIQPGRPLPDFDPALLPHVAALAHEAGVHDLAEVMTGLRLTTPDDEIVGLVLSSSPHMDPSEYTVVALDAPLTVSKPDAPLLVVATTADARALAGAPPGAATRVDDATGFPLARLAGCEQPGYVDGPLSYERL